MPESSLDVQAIAPAAMSATQPFLWSVRRELWENRSIYIAPLAAAGVAMLGFFIGLFWLPHSVHGMAGMDPGEQFLMEVMPYGHTGWLLLMTAFVVGVFYSLDALYGGAARSQHPVLEIVASFRRHNRAFEGQYSALWFCRCLWL